MKFNKQTILVLVFGGLFLAGWYGLMNRLGWTPQSRDIPGQQPDPPLAEETSERQPLQPADTVSPPATPEEGIPPPLPPPTTEAPGAPLAARTSPPAETINLASADRQVAFNIDAVDGGIVSVNLRDYEPYGQKGGGESVRLGNWRFPLCSLVAPQLALEADNGLIAENGGATLVRTATDGLEIRETWKFFSDDPYRFTYTVALSNHGGTAIELAPAITLGGLTDEGGAAGPKMSKVGTIDLAVDIAANLQQRPQSFNSKNLEKRRPGGGEVEVPLGTAWVAVHNKYFTYLIRPVLAGEDAAPVFKSVGLRVEMVAGSDHEDEPGNAHPVEWIRANGRLGGFTLKPGGAPTVFQFEGYAGPKKLAHLENLAPNADSIMRLDYFMFFRARWMEVIAKTILRSLIGLNAIFGGAWGFGFAIIVVTFVIKMLFWPLTHRSTVSMRRMAQLQPEIKKLREKYKDDSQTLNRKTMEFYRENKVNPMGGCLPMLLQIPVFFALFNTLRGAVELRHAAFFYISDLSMPDTLAFHPFGLPIRPLAILMAATMLLQQKMTPTSGDPSQKRMMTFMSIFFMFIFYSMPSGLTLYWTTNQILTIGQNLVAKRIESRKEQEALRDGTRPGNRQPKG